MPTWEAKKTRSWKVKGTTVKDFSHDFYRVVEKDITPYLKESFLRLLAESRENRMNQIEVNVSVKGRRLSRVI
jgi:hypothetical protein